ELWRKQTAGHLLKESEATDVKEGENQEGGVVVGDTTIQGEDQATTSATKSDNSGEDNSVRRK
ncbi:hypothetical protein QWJ41_20995, partial [Nocardioides sp. SOB44]